MSDHNTRPVLYPTVLYKDASAAMAWLADAFGFESLLVVPGEGDTIAHAEMTFGNGVLMVGSQRTARSEAGPNEGIYVYVEDVDAHCARARSAGAEITQEPEDTDYGSRGYAARDLEGNNWWFGTYRPGR
jgi:uncharacterized glyoxalase superfamily protein PhnB